MKASKKLLVVLASIATCAAVLFYSPPILGSQKTYELHPQVAVPEYRTDAARAIDAYERLMERYLDLTERNLFGIGADVKIASKRLDSIDRKLNELSARMTDIEKALGIVRPQPTAKP